MIYELWDDGLYAARCTPPDATLIPGHLMDRAGCHVVWVYDAKSDNDAMRALHEHMGWAPYVPMLDPDTGKPFEEDERLYDE